MKLLRQGWQPVPRSTQWLLAVVVALVASNVLPAAAAPLGYPQYIRVGRTFGVQCVNPPLVQRVDVVPFKEYVKNVLPNEWIGEWSDASLDAGAIAVAQFAYQTAFVEQKWSAYGYAFDVVDSTCDQLYVDGGSHPRTNAAVERTWGLAMVRNGAWFTPYYRADDAFCAGTGYCMSQWGSQRLAVHGLSGTQILQHYYGNISFGWR